MPKEPDKPVVLALLTEAFGGEGGIAQFNRDFLRALDSTGVIGAVHSLPRLGNGVVPESSITITQAAASSGRLSYSLAALGAALRLRPDFVLNGHLYHGPLSWLAARVAKAKLISVLHGTETWGPISPQHLRPLNASDLIICVSEDTKARYLAHAGAAAAPVRVIHNTFEERFCSGDRSAARARFGLDGLPVILTVGRLDSRRGYKGHDRVLSVISSLKEQGRQVRYLIAGAGPDKKRLEGLVAEARLGDLVNFLGRVPDELMPDLYRAADIFAMPSTGEGFGIVFIEAMACGTPAIGLNVGGAADAFAKGAIGTLTCSELFESILPDALDKALSLCDTDRDHLAATTRSLFGSEKFQRNVTDLLKELQV